MSSAYLCLEGAGLLPELGPGVGGCHDGGEVVWGIRGLCFGGCFRGPESSGSRRRLISQDPEPR